MERGTDTTPNMQDAAARSASRLAREAVEACERAEPKPCATCGGTGRVGTQFGIVSCADCGGAHG